MTDDKVECLSGQTYADRPIAIIWDGMRLPVQSIQARWRFPGGRRFLIKTEDERSFKLNYYEYTDVWSIQPE